MKKTLWPTEPARFARYQHVPLTDARSNLGEITDIVQQLGDPILLTKRDRSKAFVAPAYDIWLLELKKTLNLDSEFADLEIDEIIKKLHNVSEVWLKANKPAKSRKNVRKKSPLHTE